MTGNDPTPWSWLHSALVPAALIGTEATWASLCLSAAVNSSRHFSMDLPFLAVAVPAVTATVLCALTGRLKARWWWRTALVAGIVIVGTAVTAGVVSGYSVPGSFGAVAVHPWTVVGRVPSATAALAWFAASLAWVRGTWLGVQQVSFRHAVGSVAISFGAFIILFAVLATHHEPALHAATPGGIALFVVFFAGAAAVLALVHERDLETEALERPNSRPSAIWLTVLAVPMLIVAGIALAVAAGIGQFAALVGRGVERAVLASAGAITAVARAIGHLFPQGHQTKQRIRSSRLPVRKIPSVRRAISPHGIGHVPELVGTVALVLVIAILAIVVLRGMRKLSMTGMER